MSSEAQNGLTKCDSNPAYGVVVQPDDTDLLIRNVAYGERPHSNDAETPRREDQLQGHHPLQDSPTAAASTGEEYIYIEPPRPLELSASANPVPETVSKINNHSNLESKLDGVS